MKDTQEIEIKDQTGRVSTSVKLAPIDAPVTFIELDAATEEYAVVLADFENLIGQMEGEMEAVKQKYRQLGRTLASRLNARYEVLANLIDRGRQHFVKPRTRVAYGVKYGLHRKSASLMWEREDEALIVERIHRIFGEGANAFLHIRQAPNRDALGKCEIGVLRKLGIEIRPERDEIVIGSVESEAAKWVEEFLKEEEGKEKG